MEMANAMQAVQTSLPNGVTLSGMRGVLGAANGAAAGTDMFAVLMQQLLGTMQGGTQEEQSGGPLDFLGHSGKGGFDLSDFGLGGMGGFGGLGGMGGLGGSGIAQTLEEFMRQYQGGTTEKTLLEQLAALSGGEQGEQDDDELTNAMQLLAGMFAPAAQQLQSMAGRVAQIDESFARQALSSGIDPYTISQYLSKGENAQTQVVAPAQPEAQESFQNLLGKNGGQMTAEAGGAAQTETALSGQSAFLNSVTEAQKLLKQAGNTKSQDETLPVDVDGLQNAVDTGKFQVNNREKTAQELPTAKELLEQAKSGIKQNLALGKNEFVVKLKPAGLGEITVKLSEAENKITLSIATSSAQTAKLLAGEVEALRASLRPYNAEVREIVVTGAEQRDTGTGASFSQSYEHQQHQTGQGTEQRYYSSVSEETVIKEPPHATMEEQASELYTYV